MTLADLNDRKHDGSRLNMTREDLKNIIEQHRLWLRGDETGNGKRAYLSGVNLRGAYLNGADLSWVDLRGAYLSEANLGEANLRGSDLRGADLRGADLNWADLRGADLRGADLSEARDLVCLATPPETGSFECFKKTSSGVVKLLVPAGAGRTGSYVGRKCRAEFAMVLEGSGTSRHEQTTEYVVGKTIRPDFYDPDPRLECTNGIHFFMTRKEAEEYE